MQSEYTACFVSRDRMRGLLIWCGLIILQHCSSMFMCCINNIWPWQNVLLPSNDLTEGCVNLTTPLCKVPHVFMTDHTSLEHWCKIMMGRGHRQQGVRWCTYTNMGFWHLIIYYWYICQLQLGWHPVAVVQYTFTHKWYIEQHNENEIYRTEHT
jgi:hypothetical protein